MKNLIIYINPDGFNKENEKLTKLQIDNSLELGWRVEDIILVTDFFYEYNGVKAYVIDTGCGYCSFINTASKVKTLSYLFDIDFIGYGIYWCHDLDAFQVEHITEKELGLENFDLGLCDYGRSTAWQMGSFFFKQAAEDIFKENVSRIKPGKNKHGKIIQDENIMLDMTTENFKDINSRIKRLNITYDFGMRRVKLCYNKAIKPLKVLHFHPNSKLLNTLAIAMYGKNEINKPLMNKRLINLFNSYDYR